MNRSVTRTTGQDLVPSLPQALAVMSVDLRRFLFSRRVVPYLFLALLPSALLGTVATISEKALPASRIPALFAEMFHGMMLQGTLFFALAAAFSGLFRNEIQEKSLHFLFLSPVRRPSMVLGKYLAGLAGMGLLFGASVFLAALVLQLTRHGAPPLASLLAYLLITLLACVAYGGVFLALGLVAKSPAIPAIVVWALERFSFFFPLALKRCTVTYYLGSLAPYPVELGPLAVISDPASIPLAIVAPIVLGLVGCAVGAVALRRIEVKYGVE